LPCGSRALIDSSVTSAATGIERAKQAASIDSR
jgi:hypothetical protein